MHVSDRGIAGASVALTRRAGEGGALTTAIIGVGNLGSTVARHLVAGDEPVVLAAADEAHATALADQLGPNASAASVEDAITDADVVVLATWLDQTREFLPAETRLLEGKAVVDGRLPASAHFVKAFGSLGATQLASGANHEPRTVLFYATDDAAAEAAA